MVSDLITLLIATSVTPEQGPRLLLPLMHLNQWICEHVNGSLWYASIHKGSKRDHVCTASRVDLLLYKCLIKITFNRVPFATALFIVFVLPPWPRYSAPYHYPNSNGGCHLYASNNSAPLTKLRWSALQRLPVLLSNTEVAELDIYISTFVMYICAYYVAVYTCVPEWGVFVVE